MASFMLRRPILLYEAVEAVYAYMNEINFEDKKNSILLKYGKKYSNEEKQHFLSKIEALNGIVDDVCLELDRGDPRLLFYFKRHETDNKRQHMCLAKLMVYSFLDISAVNPDDTIAHIKRKSAEILGRPFEVTNINSGGMSISPVPQGAPQPDLVDQLDKLGLAEESKWSIYKIILRFNDYFEEMIALIRPVLPRLEKAINRILPLIGTTYDYWEEYFKEHSFFSFLDRLAKQTLTEDSLDMVVNLSVIACTDMIYTYNVLIDQDFRQVYIGILIDEDFRVDKIQLTNDSVCNILKIISDRSKFEILRKISHTSAYGQELANELNLTTATISRHMSTLQDYGLVHTRRGEMRIYYSLNKEAVENLFDMARTALLE